MDITEVRRKLLAIADRDRPNVWDGNKWCFLGKWWCLDLYYMRDNWSHKNALAIGVNTDLVKCGVQLGGVAFPSHGFFVQRIGDCGGFLLPEMKARAIALGYAKPSDFE